MHPVECHKLQDFGQKLIEKHIYESIGFQNGLNPITDTRAVGVLGPLMVINLFERLDRIYKDTESELDIIFKHSSKVIGFK